MFVERWKRTRFKLRGTSLRLHDRLLTYSISIHWKGEADLGQVPGDRPVTSYLETVSTEGDLRWTFLPNKRKFPLDRSQDMMQCDGTGGEGNGVGVFLLWKKKTTVNDSRNSWEENWNLDVQNGRLSGHERRDSKDLLGYLQL